MNQERADMVCIFDMGNVVIKGIEYLDDTVKLLGIDSKEFFLDFKHYSFPLMDGSVSVDDYYRRLEKVFNVKVDGKPFADFFHPYFNEPMVKLIERLKQEGHRVICASNTFKPHWDLIHEQHLDKYFDCCYLSHEMGLTKPSKAFFNFVLSKEGIRPEQAIFTDDFSENVETAKQLGIKTFWYYKGFEDSKLQTEFYKLF